LLAALVAMTVNVCVPDAAAGEVTFIFVVLAAGGDIVTEPSSVMQPHPASQEAESRKVDAPHLGSSLLEILTLYDIDSPASADLVLGDISTEGICLLQAPWYIFRTPVI
jgi:hypothetical protein